MFFVPTEGPKSWKALLAEPERHWRDYYSAKSIAESWEEAKGFPQSVKDAFSSSSVLQDLEFLCGFPEHKVPLPGGNRPSQNDIFVLARNTHNQLVSMTVEGKVSEPFGQYVSDWLGNNPSDRKRKRLQFLAQCLEVELCDLDEIRYQLLHRTASAIIEAKRFSAPIAVMLVHSFSDSREGLEDYHAFVKLLGAEGRVNGVTHIDRKASPDLYLAWVSESQ